MEELINEVRNIEYQIKALNATTFAIFTLLVASNEFGDREMAGHALQVVNDLTRYDEIISKKKCDLSEPEHK